MAKKKSGKKNKSDDSKVFAFLAVFLSIIGFIIALLTKRDDKYVMYYAKQSLVLFVAYVIFAIAGSVLTILTLGLFGIIMYFVGLAFFALWLVQIVYSLSGEMKETPLIGQFADKINL